MSTVNEFWPTYIDEFKEHMGVLADELESVPDEDLIMLALFHIMDEQQRTGHRSEGWPSDHHQAVRFTLHNRTEQDK